MAAIDNPTNATKLYLPVVTLSTENDKRLLEQLRAGFKITIKWNKHGSEIINRNQNNIDPTFTKVNRLSCRLKMKTMQHLFQSIMYQMPK